MRSLGLLLSLISATAFASPKPGNSATLKAPDGPTTSLLDVLKEAETSSPMLKSARYRYEATQKGIKVAQANYMPELDFAAVASTGDPGSFAFNGVDNNISAPDRIGEGGALVIKQNIWDFGRTSSDVKIAESAGELQKGQFQVSKMDIDRQVVRTYLNCAILRSQVIDSKEMLNEAELVAKETNSFVKSGQRSVVERDLVDAQAKEAATRTAEYIERVAVIEQRLAIELGRPAGEAVHCAALDEVESSVNALVVPADANPLLNLQGLRITVAQNRLDRAKAENMPTLSAIATGGYFNNDLLKTGYNYSVGVGLVFPIFTGFKIDSYIGQQSLDLSAEKASFESSKQSVDYTNSQYDEQIRSLTVRLDFLREENKLARDTFSVAKRRYDSLQGNMIDLREAIRNLDRVLQTTEETYRDIYLAKAERALFNGVRSGDK